MFDSVLRTSHLPKRRIGTGAAFAVAGHLWLLVAALAHPKPAAPHEKPAPVLDLVLAGNSPPPPLGPGGPPAKSGARTPVRTAVPRRLAPPDAPPQPAATAPESTLPASQDAAPGDGEAPGDGDGHGGGSVNGDPFGVPGGTGTGRAASPPATFLTLNLGDPSLDQSTCVLSGQPPYPKEALAQKVEGVVLARCTVEADGALSGCNVLKAPYSFEAPVKSFLATAHARPFTAAGKPARVQCVFKFNYKLQP